jgi:hypothetical protein
MATRPTKRTKGEAEAEQPKSTAPSTSKESSDEVVQEIEETVVGLSEDEDSDDDDDEIGRYFELDLILLPSREIDIFMNGAENISLYLL